MPTTIITTVPEIPTTLPDVQLTNIPSILSTAVSSFIPITEPNTINETIATTTRTKEPNTVSTTQLTTLTTTVPVTAQTTTLEAAPITPTTTAFTASTTTFPNVAPPASNEPDSTATPATVPSAPTTIPFTPTTIPFTPTTIPSAVTNLIHNTTKINTPTNVPYSNNTNIPETILNLTPTTTPTTAATSSPKTTPTTLPSSISNTTVDIKPITPSSIFVANMTSEKPVPAIFLGLSHFKREPSYYSFYIYLTAIKDFIYSRTINFRGIIEYNTHMRVLKETEGNCTLQNYSKSKYIYYCIDYEDTENVKSIKILPDLKFVEQNIDIIGVSSIAKTFIDNLLSYDERYDQLNNSTVYLMDNSTYETNGKLSFNITGRINGTQPQFENKNISLLVNLQSGQKTEANLDCVINDISFNNFSFDKIYGYLS